MKITLLAKKGGVGKSTISLLIQDALRRVGHKVAIQDWDEQGTSSKSCNFRKIQLAVPGESYAYLIYDTKPDLMDPATKDAVTGADVILIVATPSFADLWEVAETYQYAQRLNPRAIIRVVFNKVKKGTVASRELDSSVNELALPIPPLSHQLPFREAFNTFLADGWKALDGPTQQLVGELVLEAVTLNAGATQPLVGVE